MSFCLTTRQPAIPTRNLALAPGISGWAYMSERLRDVLKRDAEAQGVLRGDGHLPEDDAETGAEITALYEDLNDEQRARLADVLRDAPEA
jgi:hypothetical protein